jgi:hypothetical protein
MKEVCIWKRGRKGERGRGGIIMRNGGGKDRENEN